MPGHDQRVRETSRKILAYLSRNPNAADTIEGVARWWLLEQTVFEQTGVVEEALAELLAADFLMVNKAADSRSRFRLNPAKRAEIDEVLNQDDSSRPKSGGTEMALKIKNRSRRLLTLALNTGDSVHLAPDEVSRPLEDYEVRENRQIEKLAGRGEIGKVAMSGSEAEG